jgi:holo-[acyl-carrier protein] synthase
MIDPVIVGLGTDLVEVGRVAAALERQGEAFVEKIFTERERELLVDEDSQRRLQRIAARFAAKEAALKALGTGWGQGVGWHDVEILGGKGAPPHLQLSGVAAERLAALGATDTLLSFSHTETAATATVLLTAN